MIKKLSIGFLLAIFTIATQAQDLYSQENLGKFSTEDLSVYLTKAKKLKKTGGILLIAAPISATIGILFWADAWSGGSEGELSLGTGLMLASSASILVGIPVRITGSSRVRKIVKVLKAKQYSAMIDFVPCGIYNFQTQNNQPGIKLRIRF
jgi:hypothetical protein